jgi:putative ABC transport system permease protein
VNGPHTWRLALRIARRDALRAKGRSALVVAMIALPILGVTAADLLVRGGELSQAEELTREMGQADARYTIWPGTSGPMLQEPSGGGAIYPGPENEGNVPPPTREAIAATLPPGTTLLAERSGAHPVETRTGILRADIREIDATMATAEGPLTDGMLTLDRGHYPQRPGEIAATDAFLAESGLYVGSELRFPNLDTVFRISGAYELPDSLGRAELLAPPGSVLAPLDADAWTDYLVSVPEGEVTWDLVMAANELGVEVDSRSVILDPPPDDEVPFYEGGGSYTTGGEIDSTVVAGVVTAVALVILEICLLAGPAFAVGARRARRQLGLIGANGGDAPQLRAVMLASGLLLGAVAAATGVATGIGLTMALRPFLEERIGSRLGAWDFRVAELAGIAGLAVLVGLLAALVPAAAAARRDVLDSLTGRRGRRRTSRTLPLLGAAALVVGTALATAGGLLLDNTVVVAIGAILAELGLVAMVPMLLGVVGRWARWLPLPGRLALRDAARNRGRTAPAVAAVLAAVAGAVAATTSLASDRAEERATYEQVLPMGAVYTSVYEYTDEELAAGLADVRQAVERELPTAGRVDLRAAAPCPEAGDCGHVWTRGAETPPGALSDQPVHVGGPEVLRLLGIDDPGAAAALARGEPVVTTEQILTPDGELTLELYDRPEAQRPSRTLTLPAHHISANAYGLQALLPPATAERLGLTLFDLGSLYTTTRTPTDAERQAVDAALAPLADPPFVLVETGYEGNDIAPALLILTLCAGLLTLGAAGIATGLAQADAGPDLATLAAVGAPPRARRLLSGLQCGLIAAMGVVLGAVSGVISATGVRIAQHRHDLTQWETYHPDYAGFGGRPPFVVALPWETFAQLIVGVPVFACLLAALLTRSRVPLTRRAG